MTSWFLPGATCLQLFIYQNEAPEIGWNWMRLDEILLLWRGMVWSLKLPSHHQATYETGWPALPWPYNDPFWRAASILTRLPGPPLCSAAGRPGNSRCPLNNHHTKTRCCPHGLLRYKRENGVNVRVNGKHHRPDILGRGWADMSWPCGNQFMIEKFKNCFWIEKQWQNWHPSHQQTWCVNRSRSFKHKLLCN